jgi:hypothetical protein
MALRDMTLSVLIRAKDQASGELRQLSGDVATLESDLQAAAGGADDFSARWERSAQAAAVGGAAITAAGAAILAATRKNVAAAMVQEDAENRLRIMAGDLADAQIEYAAALQKQTRYGDEAIISAMAFGNTFPKLRNRMEEVTATALNMAEAYGMDVTQAMLLLGKAAEGQTGQLRRYGIGIDTARAKAEGLGYILEVIGNETQNAAFRMDSASKSVDALRNAVGDVHEAFGMALLPTIQELTPHVIALAEGAQRVAATPLGEAAVEMATGLGLVMVTVGPLLLALPTLVSMWGRVQGAATAAWTAMTGPVGLVIAGIVGLVAAVRGIEGAFDRAREAQAEMHRRLQNDTEVSAERVRDLTDDVHDLIAAMEQGTEEEPEPHVTDATTRSEIAAAEADMREKIARLRDQEAEAIRRFGEGSRQALEIEKRRLQTERELLALQKEALEFDPRRVTDPGFRRTHDLPPAIQGPGSVPTSVEMEEAEEALDRAFAQRTARQNEVTKALGDMADATQVQALLTGDMADATEDATEQQSTLADAQTAGADAARDYGRAQRDAARDVDKAANRIEEAEEAIREAQTAKVRAVEDASRRIGDALRAEGDAAEAAKDRIAAAEDAAARSVESAQNRIVTIRQRLADLDAPELSPAQRKQRERAKLLSELEQAEADLRTARIEGEDAVAKATEDANQMRADAARRVQDAYIARDRVIEDSDKRIAAAQKRRADAEEQYAETVERAGERVAAARDKLLELAETQAARERALNASRARSIEEVTAAYERQAAAQQRAAQAAAQQRAAQAGQPVYRFAAGGGGGAPLPQPAVAGAGGGRAGGGAGAARADVYLHLDRGVVVDEMRSNIGTVLGSGQGRQAVVRLVRDEAARR